MPIKEIENKLFLGNKLKMEDFNDIRKIGHINEFVFKNEKHFQINDTYFDTPEFILGKNNSYFRIRNKDGDAQVTLRLLKQEEEADLIIDELTHPLNIIGIRLVLQKLKEKGAIDIIDLTLSDFVLLLEKSGLIEVLSIYNDRTEKEIWVDEIKIGKIKFDYFFYNALDQIKFAEIETDIYNKIFIDGIRKLREALKNKIKHAAIKTDISKYKRGIENKLFSNKLFY